MKFFLAKKDLTCSGCGGNIERGEEVVRLSIKARQGGYMGLLFHIDCFRIWNEETFLKRFFRWKLEQTPRPKLGRPLVPTKDRKRRRQLLSLSAYHIKAGNTTRVEEIKLLIKELEYGQDKEDIS